MRFLKRFVAVALGTPLAIALVLLAGNSSDHKSQAPRLSPAITVSTLVPGPTPVTGEVLVGNVASAPKPAISLGNADAPKYRWYACAEDVPAASNALAPNCDPIAGAVSADVELTTAEVGKHILFAASFGNGRLSFSATTELPVSPAPTLSAAPVGLNKSLKFVAANTPALNSKISISRGAWPSAGAVTSVAYQWLRCQQAVTASLTAPENCSIIDGSASATYVVKASYLGSLIVAHLTAIQGGVTSEIWTHSIGPVYKAVKYYKGASVTGGQGDYPYLVDHAVTANEGTWDGPPIFKHQWYSSTAKVAAAATLNKLCKPISGASGDTFAPSTAQNGKYLMVRISGSTPLSATVITTYSLGKPRQRHASTTIEAAAKRVLPRRFSRLHTYARLRSRCLLGFSAVKGGSKYSNGLLLGLPYQSSFSAHHSP